MKFALKLIYLSNAVEAFSSVVVKVLPSNLEQIINTNCNHKYSENPFFDALIKRNVALILISQEIMMSHYIRKRNPNKFLFMVHWSFTVLL